MLIEVCAFGTFSGRRLSRDGLPDDYTFIAQFWYEDDGAPGAPEYPVARKDLEDADFLVLNPDGGFVEGYIWEQLPTTGQNYLMDMAIEAHEEEA